MRTETKSTAIPASVRLAVWLRDGQECVLCGRPVPVECGNAHIVRRSQGGRGIEQNLFTACPRCHKEHDEDTEPKYLQKQVIDYIKTLYPGWTRKSVTYHKGG